MNRSAISKRKRRRDRGKLKQQHYVLVHYYRYYGYCEYNAAALDFLRSEDAARQRRNTEQWSEYWGRHRWPKVMARDSNFVLEAVVRFNSFDEATTHVIERKLHMLPNSGVIPGLQTYYMIPWKITEQYGKGKHKRLIRVKLLGTR